MASRTWGDEADRERLQPQSVQPECFRPARADLVQPLDTSESVRFPGQPRVPGFGILQLLLWTIASAILLAVYTALYECSWAEIVGAMVVGSGLIGSWALIRAKRRECLNTLQPGHWLVLIFTVGSLLQLIGWLFSWLAYDLTPHWYGSGETEWAWLACNAFSSPILAVALVCAAVRLHAGWSWKILFLTRALGEGAMTIASVIAIHVWLNPALVDGPYNPAFASSHLIHGPTGHLADMTVLFPLLFSAIVLVLLLTAVVLDFPCRASRDWWHWLGVCCLALGNPMAIVYWLQWAFGAMVNGMLR